VGTPATGRLVRRVLTCRVIPCLDTIDGRVVKGRQFVDLRDIGSPVSLACHYEREGADELVLLDIGATPEGRAHALEMVRAIRPALGIPLTVGGGVRAVADAAALLTAGADKVAVNTAAVRSPQLLGELTARFGSQCITLAIDAAGNEAGGWQVFVRSGTIAAPRSAVLWAVEAEALGVGEILLTSIDRDGTREGFDLALIAAIASQVAVPVIASGGARVPADLLAALDAGADAVLAASMFHDGDVSIAETKRFLASRGASVRT
jgi:cyclase